MCGIVGFVGNANPEGLGRMISALAHRGPDGRGSYSTGSVHLGHTRLAIIDLPGGAQPMSSADGTLHIVFNGEIYDHADLRRELEGRGAQFRTRSDTEVILEAYRVWGTECLAHLSGMFAFVIYDQRQARLFGARDHFGKKPFYYTTSPMQFGGDTVTFAFASELTSLCHHPVIRRRAPLSFAGVTSYLLHDAVVAPRSIREGIAQLLPGEAFIFGLPESTEPGLRRWKCFDVEIGGNGDRLAPGLHESILHLLDDAVRRRMIADVPLGLFLSGGVDSSSMLALMARHRPAREIPTFSIGFDDPSFDESPYALEVAKEFGSDHHHRLFTAGDMLGRLDTVIDHLDEPLADPSILPTSLLSEFARDHVTVALSGEGGDELFAGYDPFRALGPARWLRRLTPSLLRRWLARAVPPLIPRSDENMPLDFKVERFLRGTAVDESIQLATWMGAFSMEQLRTLLPRLRDELTVESVFGDVRSAYQAADPSDINRALDFYQRFYLPNDILRKVDRASMRVGLEVRCPLLDIELAKLINPLPASIKYHSGTTKRILKEALTQGFDGKPLLPTKIIHRPKKGFGIPIARWLRNELADRVRREVIEEWPAELDAFDRTARARLVHEHMEGGRSRAKEIWSLLVLSRWVKRHIL